MTDLSPAARAVFDAWIAPAKFSPPKEPGPAQQGLAAALRAAADQCTPYSVEDMPGAAFCRNKLLAIAAELEGLR